MSFSSEDLWLAAYDGSPTSHPYLTNTQSQQLVSQAPSASPNGFQSYRAATQMPSFHTYISHHGLAEEQVLGAPLHQNYHTVSPKQEQISTPPPYQQYYPTPHTTTPSPSVVHPWPFWQDRQHATTSSPTLLARRIDYTQVTAATPLKQHRPTARLQHRMVETRGTLRKAKRNNAQHTPRPPSPRSQSKPEHQEAEKDSRAPATSSLLQKKSYSTLPPQPPLPIKRPLPSQPFHGLDIQQAPDLTDPDIKEAMEKSAEIICLSHPSLFRSQDLSVEQNGRNHPLRQHAARSTLAPPLAPPLPVSSQRAQTRTPPTHTPSQPMNPQTERQNSLVEAIMATGTHPGVKKPDSADERKLRAYLTQLVHETEEITQTQLNEWEQERLKELSRNGVDVDEGGNMAECG